MMEKKIWSAPQAVAQVFEANEYCVVCDETERVYKFKCETGGGKTGYVYLETNDREGLQTDDGREYRADKYLSRYYACGITHEAKTTDDFLEGYYVRNGNVTPVVVWRGERNNNTHCMTALNWKDVEIAKS